MTALVDGDYDGEYITQYKWELREKGYVYTSFRVEYLGMRDGRSVYRQKILYLHHMVLPMKPGFWVIHLNGDKLDNRSANLAYQTPKQVIARREDTEAKRVRFNYGDKAAELFKKHREELVMSGTHAGGKQAAETNKSNDPDFYKKIGQKGGSVNHRETRAFVLDKSLARRAGRIGGLKTAKEYKTKEDTMDEPDLQEIDEALYEKYRDWCKLNQLKPRYKGYLQWLEETQP